MKKIKKIAIIPARSGSKRIKNKNIKDFCGRPIITYSIKAALNSKIFDEIMVSTDSKKIAAIAEKSGARVPFFRSKKNSDDMAIIADVIKEVLYNYKKNNISFDYFCCIYATSPLIKIKNIKKSFSLINSSKKSLIVLPVVKYSYPIQRSLKIEKDNRIEMNWPENYKKRSQDLAPFYHDAGQFFWGRSNEFIKTKKIFTKNTQAIIVPESEVQDIDTYEDWKIAEFKYKILLNK